MNMCRATRRLSPAAVLTIVGSIAGCATVNPEPDYRRLQEQVERATGYAQAYQPGEEATIDARVGALMTDGLTAAEAASGKVSDGICPECLEEKMEELRRRQAEKGLRP